MIELVPYLAYYQALMTIYNVLIKNGSFGNVNNIGIAISMIGFGIATQKRYLWGAIALTILSVWEVIAEFHFALPKTAILGKLVFLTLYLISS